MRASTVLAGLASIASANTFLPRAAQACNNSPDLCSKSYSSITHLGAHDSPFVRDATTGYSVSGNQYYNTTIQLDAGVRLVSAQVHHSNNDWHLCHSSCDLLDAGLLSDWLRKIKVWLDNNPNEVITLLLVNSDNATPAQLHSEFTTANITSYAYRPPSPSTIPTSWPTLQTLIAAQTRLLVFIASLNAASISTEQSYLMDEFTFIFENAYDNTAPSDFKCEPDRPSSVKGNTAAALSSGKMPLLNHFLYTTGALDIESPDVGNISTTNAPATSTVGTLGYSLSQCKTTYAGRQPTFVLVDFFDEGPAINAVDAMNGITPVGRKSLPARDSKTTRADSAFVGVQALVEQVQQGNTPSRADWIWAAGKWSWGGFNLNSSNIIS